MFIQQKTVSALLMGCVMLTCLSALSAEKNANEWKLGMELSRWQARADLVNIGERPCYKVYVDRVGPDEFTPDKKAQPCGVVRDEDGVKLWLTGEIGERRSMRWRCPIAPPSPDHCRYFVLRYKANGILRPGSPFKVVQLLGKNKEGKDTVFPLLTSSQVVNDDRFHVILGKLDVPMMNEVEVTITTTDRNADIVIQALQLYEDEELPQTGFPHEIPDQSSFAETNGFYCLDLAQQYNDTLTAIFDRVLVTNSVVCDGYRKFDSGRISVYGVPFRVQTESNNVVRPNEDASVCEKKIKFLGGDVSQNDFRRVARDDLIEVVVNRKAREVFFLLAAESPVVKERYCVPDQLYRLDDVETFLVELVYRDGKKTEAFPYSMADDGCIMTARIPGVYAVAADPARELHKVVFHNRLFGVNFCLAAVTVNSSDSAVVPQLHDHGSPVQVPALPPPPPQAKYLKKVDGRIYCGNTYYDLVLDCKDGLSFKQIVNRWELRVPIRMHPSSGLEVELGRTMLVSSDPDKLTGTAATSQKVIVGNKVLSGRAFNTKEVKITGTEAVIELESVDADVPLVLKVCLAVDDTPQIKWRLSITNLGREALNPSVRFPVFNKVIIGGLEDTWLFFPQYRNVLANTACFYKAMNDWAFPLQFLDINNPVAGIGLEVMTHNLEHLPIEYRIGKDEGGVSASIRYPGENYPLAAGKTMTFPETCLVFHDGDWHQATACYQDWLKTWYQPKHARNEAFQNAFLLRSHCISEKLSWEIDHFPPIFDRQKGQYRLDEVLEADRAYRGILPDIVHFYAWYARDAELDYAYGEYSTPAAYAPAGGLAAFRAAISHLQDKLKIPVSLYTLGDSCCLCTDAAKQFGTNGVLRYSNGSLAFHTAPMKYHTMCLGYKPWQDYYVQDVVKLQKDTGARIIYLDVCPLHPGHTCYAKDHGHENPQWLDKTSYQVVSRIREALPKDVAIFSEYPQTDVNSQYIDGNFAYYFFSHHEIFSRNYRENDRPGLYAEMPFSVYRFVFPHIRQFSLAFVGERLSLTQIIFFNGEPEGECTFRLYSDRTLPVGNKSLRLKKKYLDCFTSSSPRSMTPTEQTGIYANEFPGKGRTLWTLYNTGYASFTGPALAVEHHAGATYYDAWNDVKLFPQIKDGKAMIVVPLKPQGLGCVVQETP